MTDAPRPDLDNAERVLREDHHSVCRWPHAKGAPSPGDCVGDCEEVCYGCGEDWPCSTETMLAEYDRRGAALADAHTENARLRAGLERLRDNLREFVREHADPGTEALGALWEADHALAAAPTPTEDGGRG